MLSTSLKSGGVVAASVVKSNLHFSMAEAIANFSVYPDLSRFEVELKFAMWLVASYVFFLSFKICSSSHERKNNHDCNGERLTINIGRTPKALSLGMNVN